jgi:propionyl-CoA carboxylase alpha chain
MGEQSVALAKAVDYQSAGTVEFIVDKNRNFYFLEMNTRLQVEHPVTELITGVDLVEQMIRVAAGEALKIKQEDVELNGWAIESRLYAEDPYRNFLPSIGRLTRYRPPREGKHGKTIIRNDTGVTEGSEISMFYDPMIAKLCTWGPDRAAAVDAMADALDRFEVEGIGHNLPFCSALMQHPRWREGRLSTGFIAEEYPDGFAPVEPDAETAMRLAIAAALFTHILEERNAKISGARFNQLAARAHQEKIACLNGEEVLVRIDDTEDVFRVFCGKTGETGNLSNPTGSQGRPTVADHSAPSLGRSDQGSQQREEEKLTDHGAVTTDWTPGKTLAELHMDGRTHAIKVNPVPGGWRLRQRGVDIEVKVLRPRVAELSRLMPEKVAPDTSNLLLCPMPGMIVSVAVAEGDEVQEGQQLAIVEAMKMENVLRAEKKGIVKKIVAQPGDSLAVDAVIMEFER